MTKFFLSNCWMLILASSSVAANASFKFNNSDTGVRLPKPMSDVSAVVGPDNLIYIAGGCDSPFGSQYDQDAEGFRCGSVSDSFYAFNPETEEFTELPSMPEGRFRHAAVSVNNQIWLVGGRNRFDELVGDVHVYDLEDQRWRRFRDLHETYWLSDLGSFSARGRAWFVGGFTRDYRAVRKVWSINPRASWAEGRLRVVRHSNLLSRRGDVGVTLDAEERFVYVSGGSSNTNDFCSPLSTVEKYDIEYNEWEEVAPLTQARTGKTVIQLNDQIIALGGAQQISKICDKNRTKSDPSDMQTPVYGVEVFNQGEWTVVDNLANYRFRSTTVVYNGTVYSFGGQSVYFSVCECHPTVDTVTTYEQVRNPLMPGQASDHFAPDQTYDYNFQDQGVGFSNQGADSLNESPVDNTGIAEEKSDFDADADEKESDETNESGFGGYHRDKSDGFTAYSSAPALTCPNLLFAAIIGVLAVLVL